MEADYRLKYAVVLQLKEYGIALPRLPAPSKKQDQPTPTRVVFGTPLDVVVANRGATVEGLLIPETLLQMSNILRKGLATEGLFRVNGSTARMKIIQTQVDNGGEATGSIHDIAGLLKLFLRLLPDPLLTYRLYQPLVTASQLQDDSDRMKAVLLLLFELPQNHLHSIIFLMKLLYDVVSSPGSRMTATNLAAILTPNILRPESHSDTTVTSELELSNHSKAVAVVELLILNYETIGTPPVDLLRNVENIDQERARLNYFKLIMPKRPFFWWLFGRRSRRARAPVRKAESLSSHETLDLIHKGFTARKGKRQESSTSIQSLPMTTISTAVDATASKSHSVPKSAVARKVSNMSLQQKQQQQKRQDEEDAVGFGTSDDPPVPTIDVKEPPGLDSFMMY